ncbi:MAG: aspartate dehydrogenase [Lachnospiraceae bacterium]
MFFGKKKKAVTRKEYDHETLEPVLKCSICFGEQIAAFRDKKTGKIHEVCFIKTQEDLEQFMETYGITEPVKKVY